MLGTIVDGKYRIERLRGLGAMAEVYEVVHLDLQSRFALKIALPEIAEDPELSRRFENEARVAARLRSDHIARVVDVGRVKNRPYMVMELLEGEDLEELGARVRVLPVAEAVDHAIQACAGLEVAHTAGVVHRDLKPSNLFLCKDGTIKIVDFGVSTSFSTDARITKTGSVLGSPAYMSPEQLRSAKHVDGRADVWSIGVILYELLTGSMPFFGENVGAVFAAILEVDPPPPSTRSAGLPPGLDEVILKCLRRKAEERWPSARELAYALAPWASDQGRAVAARITGRFSLPEIRVSRPSIITETISSVPPASTTIPPGARRSISAWAESMKTPRARSYRGHAIAATLALGVVFATVVAWKLGERSTSQPPPLPAAPPSQTAVVVPVVPVEHVDVPVVAPAPTPSATVAPVPKAIAKKDAGAPEDEERIFGRH